MKNLAILCALVALSGCSPISQEETNELVGSRVTEMCYDGVVYLSTYVRDGVTLTVKIDAKTLKPVNCENESK